MWQFNMQHGRQGRTQYRDELGRISTIMGIHQMHCGQLPISDEIRQEIHLNKITRGVQ